MRFNTSLRPAGFFFLTGGGTSEDVEIDTRMCVHCGLHYTINPGIWTPSSYLEEETRVRTRRGFCTNCNGPTCGAEKCGVCIPLEQQVDNLTAGRHIRAERPDSVSFSGIELPFIMKE